MTAGLRDAYRAFLRPDRLLLTGHSHQAWPDVVRDAGARAFDDAATYADDKWGHAVFPLVDRVGRAILGRLGLDEGDAIAFGQNTHELVFRLLSAFPQDATTRVVTTTSEFHSLFRQLSRLAETGVRVAWVDARERAGLTERLLAEITPGTSLVCVSAVLFEDAYVVDGLARVVARAREVGATMLVDAYHAFNVVPVAWGPHRDHLFVTGGGYKYAQMGEGVCFLRAPRESTLRPVFSGWFADYAALERPRSHDVGYGDGGARFAGATFDATAFYRAEAALAHFDRFGLGVERLRAISLAQTRLVVDVLDREGLGTLVASSRDDARRGGFVAVRSPRAQDAVKALRARGVFVDARADLLRIGPAPYLTDDEIDRGTTEVARALRG